MAFTVKLNKDNNTVFITAEIENSIVEISGSYEESEFNPSWFSDDKAEQFYNSNWEAIDRKINTLI